MRVLATQLWDALSITLVDDGRGWRFGSWTTLADRSPGRLPSCADRARRFRDAQEALAYFRHRYRPLPE